MVFDAFAPTCRINMKSVNISDPFKPPFPLCKHRTHRVFLHATFFLLFLSPPAAGVHLFTGRIFAQQAVQLLSTYHPRWHHLQLQTIREVPQSANAILHNLAGTRRKGFGVGAKSSGFLNQHDKSNNTCNCMQHAIYSQRGGQKPPPRVLR